MNDKLSKPIYPDYSKEAHERTITIIAIDRLTGEEIGYKTISKGLLAKYLAPISDHQVIGARDGKFKIEF